MHLGKENLLSPDLFVEQSHQSETQYQEDQTSQYQERSYGYQVQAKVDGIASPGKDASGHQIPRRLAIDAQSPGIGQGAQCQGVDGINQPAP